MLRALVAVTPLRPLAYEIQLRALTVLIKAINRLGKRIRQAAFTYHAADKNAHERFGGGIDFTGQFVKARRHFSQFIKDRRPASREKFVLRMDPEKVVDKVVSGMQGIVQASL